MSARAAIAIGGWVTPAERPMLAAAAGQLGECLADPGEPRWPVTLDFAADPTRPPAVLIAGLLGAAEEDAPTGAIAERLGGRLAAALAGGCGAAFLCTLFRFVADPARRAAAMPRIRALNLIATGLSHANGIGVIDVDRVFALFGARGLQTDYRLGGPAAAEVAGHVIVSAVLANGLDAFLPIARQERAIARHGGLHQIAATVDRRLRARAAGQADGEGAG